MGYILSDEELIDGAPRLDVELRRESLYLHPPEGERHAFAYGYNLSENGGEVTTVELSYPFLRQVVRWATSEQGRRLLSDRGAEVDW